MNFEMRFAERKTALLPSAAAAYNLDATTRFFLFRRKTVGDCDRVVDVGFCGCDVFANG